MNPMDAVDDIPPQLKAEIALAMDKEIDRQVDADRGRKALDLFLLFRAGLAVCREALQEQQRAPIGGATQRAMAGPEIPHNEAGVPIIKDAPKSGVRFYQHGTEFFPFGPAPFGEVLLELDGSTSYVSSRSPETKLHITSAPERELNFNRQERELRESPSTWLPALLRTVVETTAERKVFKEGVLRFVEIILETRPK